MKIAANFNRNKYKANVHRVFPNKKQVADQPLPDSYKVSTKGIERVYSKDQYDLHGDPVNLNPLERGNPPLPFLDPLKSRSTLKADSLLFQKEKKVHKQLLQFLKSSSHFGRKSRHLDFAFPWHASMCNKFSGVRNKVPHINAEETLQSLVKAFYCIALVLRKGGKVLVVNKNTEFAPLFYPNSFDKRSPLQHSLKGRPATAALKWVGGCLTNWREISKSVATLLYFSKRFGGFIKQNNIHFPQFKKMKNSFQGFINIEKEQLLLKEKPQLLFLFNANESQQILHEAIALQIPVVALTDSSTDLSQITYPIPINSDSAHLVYRCLSQLMQITERQGSFSK